MISKTPFQIQFPRCIRKGIATLRPDSFYDCGKLKGICGSKHCQKAKSKAGEFSGGSQYKDVAGNPVTPDCENSGIICA